MAQGQGQATQVRLSRAAEAPYLEPEPWEYDPRYLTFDPQAPGLDDVDPVPTDEAVVARAALRRDLARTGLPSPVVEMLGKVVDVASPACATGATSAVESDLADAELVAVAQAARGLQAFADGVVSSVVRALAPRVGQVLLARAGVSSPGDLSHTARQRWRARVKSLIAHELSVATGWGIQSCHDRVGFALAPGSATAPAAQALQAGLTDWREVGQWWRSCRDLETDEAAQVARALFDPMADSRPGGGDGDSCNGGDGGDESADDDHSPSDGTASEPEDDGGLEPPDHAEPGSADDRETWDDTRQPGALVPDQRWPSWSEYQRDLDREVARVRGADAQDARRRRKEALDRRGIRAVVFDDGTGELCVTGPATSVIAAAERLSTIAFKARQAGDARTRSQIESDTTLALLVHGTLPLPAEPCLSADGSTGEDAGSAEEPLAPAAAAMLADYQEQLATIVTGMPIATVELIVPFDMLLPAGGTSGGEASGGASGGGASGGRSGSGASGGTSRGGASGGTSRGGASGGTPGGGADGDPHPPDPDNLLAFPARPGPQEEPPAGLGPPGGPVAEAVGYGFLTPEFVREILASPGTVIHRLLTDPADGRAVERSITAYRPDEAMRRQLLSADVTCRGPGCTVPARRSQLDHVIPFGAGGPTSETNLNHKHLPHHQFVTAKFWHSVMDETRGVTWRTLLGRVYREPAHDYRQYSQPARTPRPGLDSLDDLVTAGARDQDLANRLIYAALCQRGPGDGRLAAVDDHTDASTELELEHAVRVMHRRGSSRRSGPPPGQPTPGQILAFERGLSGVDPASAASPADQGGAASPAEAAGHSPAASPADPTAPWNGVGGRGDDEPPF